MPAKCRDRLDVTGPPHRSAHGSRRHPPAPIPPGPAVPTPLPTRVRVDGDRIVVERLVLADAALAAFLAERPATTGRPSSSAPCASACSRSRTPASRSTWTSSGPSSRSSCARPSRSTSRPPQALEQTLRANFADGDGRLPRTLEKFLGDRGALRGDGRRAVRRDEARQRHRPDRPDARALLRRRRLQARATCSTRPGSTRRCTSSARRSRTGSRALEERLVAIEAAAAARGAERARSAAKGGDFEDLLEAMLGRPRPRRRRPARPDRDRGRRRHQVQEGRLRPDPRRAGRARLRPAGRRSRPRTARCRCGRCARSSARPARTAARPSRLVVFTPAHAPAGVAPFNVVGDDVYCVIDPEAPDPATLEAAVRLARLLALASLASARSRWTPRPSPRR